MHIGLIAHRGSPIPPLAYGGIERVVALQAAGLAAAGHDVTLVAAPGSAVPEVRVVSPLDAVPAQIGMVTDEWRHVLGGMDALADVDVVVDHSGLLGALLSAQARTPALHVVHGSLETELLGLYNGLVARAPRLRLAAISRSQRDAAPHLPEPFGMVLVEAMACGTPVIATDRGAVGEIVRDGVTGFVRDTTAELAPLIGRIGEIDRAACRRHVTEHFSSDALVRSYIALIDPLVDLRVPAPMVFSSPAPSTRPLVPHRELARRPAFSAPRRVTR